MIVNDCAFIRRECTVSRVAEHPAPQAHVAISYGCYPHRVPSRISTRVRESQWSTSTYCEIVAALVAWP